MKIRIVFTALYTMQSGISHEKYVCLSVRPSVCQTRECDKTK